MFQRLRGALKYSEFFQLLSGKCFKVACVLNTIEAFGFQYFIRCKVFAVAFYALYAYLSFACQQAKEFENSKLGRFFSLVLNTQQLRHRQPISRLHLAQ